MRRAIVALVGASILASSATAIGDATTRAEYIRAADRICAQTIKPTNRAWRGFDRNVEQGNYMEAADQVARAREILANSVRRVAALKRPAGDGPLLTRLFKSKRKEVRLYKRSERAFRHGNEKGGLSWIRVRIRQKAHSRRIVSDYGFKRCGPSPEAQMRLYIGLAAFGGILVATAWPTFSELFKDDADNEPIVYLLVGGLPLLLGVLFIAAGIWGLVRRPSSR